MMEIGKVIACLKHLAFPPKIAAFEDRLRLQKIVCLLELKGIRLGFDYGLYVRGPYSPDLAKEMFGRTSEFERLHTSVRLSSREETIVNELKQRFEMKSSLLEIAATYGYLIKKEHNDPLIASRTVKRLKPFYSEAQVAVGISRAKQFLFEPTEAELAAMRKEHAVWESASLS